MLLSHNDFPKSEEVLKKAGVLVTIEEYIQRRRETIMKYAKMTDIYGKCKSSQKITSNLLWWAEVNYNSNDAAEALTRSQTHDG
jgi:DNA repair photolyase